MPSDTITVPRELFERLVECTITLYRETQWEATTVERRELRSTIDEAVAIRDSKGDDGGK